VDFHFWFGETGVVVRNGGEESYLGIIVKLDAPRQYVTGAIIEQMNFEPYHLAPVMGKQISV
jgi:hypothetical protein